MGVSLRVVISVVSALSVAVVAAITLSITLTSSLAALRDVGTGQSEALLRSAQINSENLFAAPQDAVETLQNISRTYNWAWPANDAVTRQKWTLLGEAALMEARGRLDSVIVYFRDDTYILSGYSGDESDPWLRPGIFQVTSVTFGSPITNLTHPRSTPNRTAMPADLTLLHTGNRTNIPSTDPLFGRIMPPFEFQPDSETGTWANPMMLASVNGASDVNAGVVSAAHFGQVQSFIPFIGAMYLPGGRRGIDEPYAFAVAALMIEELSEFLRATRATSGTLAVAVDRSGFLLASSSDRTVLQPARMVAAGTAAPPGCTTTEATGSASTDPNNYLSCRVRSTAYGSTVLNAVMEKPALAFSASRVVELLDTPDGVYFAGAAPVRMKFRGSTVHLLLMIPEADVIGDVVRSRNVAIGVTCAVFVIVAALTFVAITLLLSPLGTIAERMQRAADFDDDGSDETVSAMAEVAALQRAYYEMNDELNRIRSFVPQSVLVAKQRQRAYLDGDDEDEEDDDFRGSSTTAKEQTGSVRSVRSSHRSRRSKQSRSSKTPPTSVAGGAGVSDASLQIKTVAVLVANASEFTTLSGGPPSASTAQRSGELLAELVEAVELAIGVNGGVLGNFHGDHFTATFNAVRPCTAPPRRACAAALALLDRSPGPTSSATSGLRFHMGIASGRCLIGNTGTATAKTFSVVGPAFTQANFLERLAKLYGPECRALVTDRVCGDIVTQFRYRYVDHVLLPPRQPMLIAALFGAVGDDADTSQAGDGGNANAKPGEPRDNEWLYVLEAQESADPNGRHNAIFQCLARRQLDECVKGLEQPEAAATEGLDDMEDTAKPPGAPPAQPGTSALANLVREFQKKGGGTGGAAPTTNLVDLHEAFLRPL